MGRELDSLLLGAVLDAEGPMLRTTAGALLDASGVRQDDLTDARVRSSWGLAAALASRNRPVDAQTVYAAGVPTGLFRDADLQWLQQLQAGNALDGARFGELCTQLRKASRSTKLQSALVEELKRLKSGADVVDISTRVEQVARELGVDHARDGSGDEDVMELAAAWEAQQSEDRRAKPLFISTGVRGLDEAIGGFVANLNMVVGQPSVGKSALLGSCIEGQLELGIKPGIFGLEDGTMWLAERLIAKRLGIPLRAVGHARIEGQLAEKYGDAMQWAMNFLRPLVCFRHDTVKTAEMIRRAAHWVQNLGVQCIYVDHGGEVEHQTDRFDDYRLAVGETYRELRNFAIRYKVPVVAINHTNRAGDRADGEERPPLVTEIAESAYIERRARTILGLWERQSKPEHLRVTVLKNTKGERWRTYGIKRHRQVALVDRDEWEELSITTEKRDEAKQRRLEKIKTDAEAKEAKEKAAAELKAKKKGPQKTLGLEVIDGGGAEPDIAADK